MDCEHCRVDFRKVFDLILEVAVNKNLKAEQMIKRVFLWESDYELIRSKYKEKGYSQVVPHLVVWNLKHNLFMPPFCATQQEYGVTVLNDFSNNLIKSFLDNDGEICPDLLMEAAISPQPYQTLVVVD
ncbi:flavin-containing monooxygenase FMO GS-OX-like 9 [Pyrus ussuriensis x Pyrus communis]|uniref:Flavin-containing monooxygenase FMO GS-OX-like 9 n=1 Tax=Pyrus ussuriensis x Pyrus communis TaxID=2448454 RepID=A0A5N5G2P9_9ROSA|nr:flavin-containing monooxygenase FMO GS-OX-like 9 [Pyrus ussuriensis x Pyrus communis]